MRNLNQEKNDPHFKKISLLGNPHLEYSKLEMH